MSDIRETIADAFGDQIKFFDGLDSAIIGVTTGMQARDLVVYSRSKIVEHFISEGMSEEEAEEWVSFNVEGAYMEGIPIVMAEVSDADPD